MKRLILAMVFMPLFILTSVVLVKVVSRYQDYQRSNAAFDHWMKGEQLSRAGYQAAAIDELQSAIQIDPRETGARYHLARIYRKQGLVAHAITEYQIIINQNSRPQDKTGAAWAHYELGELIKAQSPVEARAEWRAAIACAPIDTPQQAGIYKVRVRAEQALAENLSLE